MPELIPKWEDTVEMEEPANIQVDAAVSTEPVTSEVPQWDETTPSWDDTEEISPITEWDSALAGAVQGASFGFADEAKATIAQTWESLKAGDFEGYKEGYTKLRDQYRKEDVDAMLANPKSFLAGELAGAVAVPIPGAVAAKGVMGAAKLGAKYGAAYGLGKSEADLTEGEVGQALIDTGVGSVAGAAGGALISKATQAAPGAIKAATSKGIEKVKEATGIARAERIIKKFTSPSDADKSFMNKPIADIIAGAGAKIKSMTPKELMQEGAKTLPMLIAPGAATLTAAAGMAAKKFVPLSVNKVGAIYKKYKPAKLQQMGKKIGELMQGPNAKLQAYAPAFENALTALGVGGAGVVHTHLLSTDPAYREIVKEELKNSKSKQSLLFN